jgi:hypothetical protein
MHVIPQAAEVMRQIRDEERAGRGALFFIGKSFGLFFIDN